MKKENVRKKLLHGAELNEMLGQTPTPAHVDNAELYLVEIAETP